MRFFGLGRFTVRTFVTCFGMTGLAVGLTMTVFHMQPFGALRTFKFMAFA